MIIQKPCEIIDYASNRKITDRSLSRKCIRSDSLDCWGRICEPLKPGVLTLTRYMYAYVSAVWVSFFMNFGVAIGGFITDEDTQFT